MNREKMKLNFRWITPIISIITLIGIVYEVFAKPYKWDQAAQKTDAIAIVVDEHTQELAEIKAKLDDMKSDTKEILRRLDK